MPSKFIAVAGNIGVGKSSLVHYLTTQYGFKPFAEPNVDNPYLDDFYEDFARWSFHSQIYFLTHKFRLHMDLSRTEGIVVQDRTIYEDAEIFARILHDSKRMDKRDFKTYWELYEIMRAELPRPDLMIYLRCNLRAIKKRIKIRARPNEQAIPDDYLRRLNKAYDAWIESYDLSPVLLWQSDKMDYLTDLVDRIEFHKALQEHLDVTPNGGALPPQGNT